ncbi:MAG: hypothetical protein JSU83_19835 [Deltaproteobacteria bacterium]|nr:MAG: hypothetical protein JSU83_19835 [Deltaproteobacteria bacterium]
MVSNKVIKNKEIAVLDRERKGILIHKDQLKAGPFKIGDRFSIKIGKVELFTLTIVKDDNGEILFDKDGILIRRTRRIDMLLGGIFDEYILEIEPEKPNTIVVKPLQVVMENEIL